MHFPKIIRANPKRLRYKVLHNGGRHEATPPTYRLFGVDVNGDGIYRCYQTVISIDEHKYAWIPKRTFVALPSWVMHRYDEVIE